MAKRRTGPPAGKKTAAAKGDAAPVGVRDYTEFIFEWGHPEWVVLCAEASGDALAAAFADTVGAEARWPQVAVRPAPEPPVEMFPSLVPVVEVSGSGWSSALWVTAWPVDQRVADEAMRAAKKLSTRLKARTLTFMGNDTAGAQDLQVFERGKQLLHKGWFDDDAEPAFFKQAGVYVPPCYAAKNRKPLSVGAPPAVASRIVRVDLVDIGDALF
jgi:hypothetical protein